MKTMISTSVKLAVLLGLGLYSTAQACTLSHWSATQDTGGNLSTASGAQYEGSCGLIVQLNGATAAYVEDNSPGLVAPAVSEYRARFYIYVSSLQMDVTDSVTIFSGVASDESPLFDLNLSSVAGMNRLSLDAYDDQGSVVNPSSFISLDKGWRAVELVWLAATSDGSNDGGAILLVDDVLKQNITDINNDTLRVNAVRLGGVFGNADTVSGRIDFDSFKSQRTTQIGLVPKECATSQSSLSVTNTTFLPGSANCSASSDIQMGYRTTIDSNTTMSIRAPSVVLTSGVSILNGAVVTIGQ